MCTAKSPAVNDTRSLCPSTRDPPLQAKRAAALALARAKVSKCVSCLCCICSVSGWVFHECCDVTTVSPITDTHTHTQDYHTLTQIKMGAVSLTCIRLPLPEGFWCFTASIDLFIVFASAGSTRKWLNHFAALSLTTIIYCKKKSREERKKEQMNKLGRQCSPYWWMVGFDVFLVFLILSIIDVFRVIMTWLNSCS